MILHLLTNEQFTDYAIAQFSASEMKSEFVLIPSNHEDWKMKLMDKCTIIRQGSSEFKELLNHLGDYTGIILHGMFWGGWQKHILQRVPEHVKVAWVFWGGEIYGRSDSTLSRYAPITNLVVRIREIMNGKKKCVNTSWELPLELYQRIDYCLTDELEEFEYVREFFKNEHMQHGWYNYYDLDTTLGALKNESCNGNNIIVGNSATDTCNYFDVIPHLRRYLQKEQKVILPLSYGAPWIKNIVSKYAKFWLGKHSMPLYEYMPRENYNRLIQSCSTMIMAHYIPQAQGNILTGLWLGMRVYLSEKSIAYKFFKRLGCIVYSFESEFKIFGLSKLSEDQKNTNREILSQWYSSEHTMLGVKNIVETLLKNDIYDTNK